LDRNSFQEEIIMDYGNVFSRAWQICWNHKYFFVLGFLAALGGGAGNSGQQANFSFSGNDLPPDIAENLAAFAWPLVLLLCCIILVGGLVIWLLRLAAQAGMISAASRIDEGEEVSFGQAFSAGTRHLLRFAGLNLLIYAPLIVAGIVIAIAAVVGFIGIFSVAVSGETPPETMGAGLIAGVLCMLLVACLLALYGLFASVIYPFAQRGIVLKGLDVVASIRHGWRVVSQNLGDVIVLIVLFLVLGLVFGAIVTAVLFFVGALGVGPTVIDLVSGGTPDAADIGFLGLGILIVTIVGAVINSVYTAFRSVVVTLAYQEFVAPAKLVEK
jgi:hypothetical protein